MKQTRLRPPQFGDLEIVFVVFDILYLDSGSVINRTLTERHELLRHVLGPQQTTAIPVGAAPHLFRRLAGTAITRCEHSPGTQLACSMCRRQL